MLQEEPAYAPEVGSAPRARPNHEEIRMTFMTGVLICLAVVIGASLVALWRRARRGSAHTGGDAGSLAASRTVKLAADQAISARQGGQGAGQGGAGGGMGF